MRFFFLTVSFLILMFGCDARFGAPERQSPAAPGKPVKVAADDETPARTERPVAPSEKPAGKPVPVVKKSPPPPPPSGEEIVLNNYDKAFGENGVVEIKAGGGDVALGFKGEPLTDYGISFKIRRPVGASAGDVLIFDTPEQGRQVRYGQMGNDRPADDKWHEVREKFRTVEKIKEISIRLRNTKGATPVFFRDFKIRKLRAYEPEQLAGLDAGRAKIETHLVGTGSDAALIVTVDGKIALDTTGLPLFAATACDVAVSSRDTENGCVLSFRVANNTDTDAVVPCFQIDLPWSSDARLVDPSRVPGLRAGGQHKRNHPRDSYPGVCYSPITGIAAYGFFIGFSLMYDVEEAGHPVGVQNYYSTLRWSVRYRPLGTKVPGTHHLAPFPDETLAPGKSRTYQLSVGMVPEKEWVTAYAPYRDFFRAKWGGVRYKKDLRPIAAFSFGIVSNIRPDNPQGYSYRLDQLGWGPFVDKFLNVYCPAGWSKFMIWQVAGSYNNPQAANMVFEISSGMAQKGRATIGELKRLTEKGVTPGFWMGRCTSISTGYNMPGRIPLDVDKPEIMKYWHAEVGQARDWGVGLIGMDATHSGRASKWNPSGWYLNRKFFPMLHEKYPGMEFVVEPAAVDYSNLWGPSFVWDGHIHDGEPEFVEYLNPGATILCVIKRGRMKSKDPRLANQDPSRLEQVMKWGYVPLVFESGDGLFDLTQKPVAWRKIEKTEGAPPKLGAIVKVAGWEKNTPPPAAPQTKTESK